MIIQGVLKLLKSQEVSLDLFNQSMGLSGITFWSFWYNPDIVLIAKTNCL